jgi:hypothetical protein
MSMGSSPISPIIHPALDLQAEFAPVGIVDAEGKAVGDLSDAETFKKYDAQASVEKGRWSLRPSPIVEEPVARGDLQDFLAHPIAPIWVSGEGSAMFFYVTCNSHARTRHLCSCWIVGTYLHQVFPTFPTQSSASAVR